MNEAKDHNGWTIIYEPEGQTDLSYTVQSLYSKNHEQEPHAQQHWRLEANEDTFQSLRGNSHLIQT